MEHRSQRKGEENLVTLKLGHLLYHVGPKDKSKLGLVYLFKGDRQITPFFSGRPFWP